MLFLCFCAKYINNINLINYSTCYDTEKKYGDIDLSNSTGFLLFFLSIVRYKESRKLSGVPFKESDTHTATCVATRK